MRLQLQERAERLCRRADAPAAGRLCARTAACSWWPAPAPTSASDFAARARTPPPRWCSTPTTSCRRCSSPPVCSINGATWTGLAGHCRFVHSVADADFERALQCLAEFQSLVLG